MTSPTTGPATGERACACCGRLIEVPANNPHKRYCSPRCRVADWHHHHDRPRNDIGPADPAGAKAVETAAAPAPNDVPDPNTVPVPNGVPDPNAVPAPGQTTPCCPHCRQPITVLTLLLPPAAAHVTVPRLPTQTGSGDD